MLIGIPKNYKKSRGSRNDPIGYLCGKKDELSPEDELLLQNLKLFDHKETFVDKKTKERIFVSHPYGATEPLIEKLKAALKNCDVEVTYFEDSWYNEHASRIELRNAKARSHVKNGGRVLRYGKRVLVCECSGDAETEKVRRKE